MLLSVIIPCYNEENNITPLYRSITEELAAFLPRTELIFINDGSNDRTRETILSLFDDKKVKCRLISFSRNFGKEAALLAGLEHAKGEFCAIIDADLQQDPRYIVRMLEIIGENPEYDGVCAYQSQRGDGKTLSFFKNCFYKLINQITEIEFYRSASDFRVLNRKMVDAILSMPEKRRFSKGIFSWVGFKVCYIPYEAQKRQEGKTKWNFGKLLSYAIDGIVAFSDKPLILSSVLGVILFFISMIMLSVLVIKTLIFGDPVAGFPTLASLILLSSGIQLFTGKLIPICRHCIVACMEL